MKQLLFTTTTPYSLFSINEDAQPLVDITPYKGVTLSIKKTTMHNIYIHGDLQGKAGFDIPVFLDGDMPTEDGIYDCTGLLPEQIECKLYLWIREDEERVYYRGLIVDPTNDTDSVKYAEEKYNEKAQML